ncbi:MAG: hypothetical protein FWG87_01815 [Defluviitaleaceae bacterium]|nr:hypothetical protein [Defluviitaleaceae bacterium]
MGGRGFLWGWGIWGSLRAWNADFHGFGGFTRIRSWGICVDLGACNVDLADFKGMGHGFMRIFTDLADSFVGNPCKFTNI